MRYCVNCGAMNDTDANFCSGCGKKFESAVFDEQKKDFQTENVQENIATENNVKTDEVQAEPVTQSNTAGNNNNYQTYQQTVKPDYNTYQGDAITGDRYNGMSVASLVLGICSIVFSWIIPVLPLAAAIVGLVLGNKVKKYGDNGKAKAGRITSIIGIVLIGIQVLIVIIAFIGIFSAVGSNPEIFDRIFDYYY